MLHLYAAAVPEGIGLAHRLVHHQDVAEHDGRVEGKAAQGLHRDLGRQVRRLHHGDEVEFLLDRSILGQVTPGLPHDPNRRALEFLAAEGFQETFSSRHHLSASQSRG